MDLKQFMGSAPWIKKAQETPKTGLNIQAYVRDLLMSEWNVDVQQAQAFADKFAAEVESAGWLETSRGVQFDLKSDPSAPGGGPETPGMPPTADDIRAKHSLQQHGFLDSTLPGG